MTAAPDETIVAVATPPGTGAVASSASAARPSTDWRSDSCVPSSPLRPRIATRATLLDEDGEPLDHGLALLFPRPHSYTGEDLLELHVPWLAGRRARSRSRRCSRAEPRLAGPGEFTRRAFSTASWACTKRRRSPTVIDAETRRAARAALANLESGVGGEVRRTSGRPGGGRSKSSSGRDRFSRRSARTRPRRPRAADRSALRAARAPERDGEAGRVAARGPHAWPSSGRRTPANLRCSTPCWATSARSSRRSPEPPATRSRSSLAIDGIPVRLIDTAGIRAPRRPPGGRRHRPNAGGPRGGRHRSGRHRRLAGPGRRRRSAPRTHVAERTRILYLNKADLGTDAALARRHRGAVAGSVREAATVQALREAIAQAGWRGASFDATRPHLSALHEFEAVNDALGALRQALESLAAGEPVDFAATELGRAFSALGHVSEPVAAEEIIAGIFSRFCIGK